MNDRIGCLGAVALVVFVIWVHVVTGLEKKDVYITTPTGTFMYTVKNMDIDTSNWGQTTDIWIPERGGKISAPTKNVMIMPHKEE